METETTWIDAWIRWDRNSKEIVDDDGDDNDDDCEEEERVPPSTEFSFHYKLPSNEVDAADSTSTTLTLTLKGFPSESEQIWNSTGLTLWPSSHYLCEYLLDHYRELLLLDPAKRSTTNSNSNSTTTTTTTSALNNHPRNNELDDNDTKTKTKKTTTTPPRKIRAVELGSGLGRCGLLLYHLLKTTEQQQQQQQQQNIQSHVYLTDGDTDTLAQLRDNVIDNTTTMNRNNDRTESESEQSILPMTSIADKDQKHEQQPQHNNDNSSIHPNHDLSCHQLLWGRDSTEAFCERHFSNEPSSKPSDDDDHHHRHSDDPEDNASSTTSNSSSTTSTIGVDLVFGSDLIYAPRVIGPLFETVSTLLKHGNRNAIKATTNRKKLKLKSKSIFLMAHSDRREGSSVTLKAVLDGAETAGLEFEILQNIEREGIYIIAFRIQQQ